MRRDVGDFCLRMMALFSVLALLAALVPSTALAEDDDDEEPEEGALPYPLNDATSARVGGSVYTFGGYSLGMVLDSIIAYEPTQEEFEHVTEVLPYVVRGASSFSDGQKAYIIGGYGYEGVPLDNLTVFSPAGGCTAYPHALPYGLKGHSVVWTGKYAYFFGNCVTTSKCGSRGIVRFDPAAMDFTVSNNTFPVDIAGTSAVWSGGAAYIFGGNTKSGPTDRIYRWIPGDSTVKEMEARLPTPRYSTGAVLLGDGKVCIFGGMLKVGFTAEVLKYDIKNDTISFARGQLPFGLASRSYAVGGDGDVADEILIIGGAKSGGVLTALVELEPDPKVLTPNYREIAIISAAVWILAGAVVIVTIRRHDRITKGKK